jgi:hypothetical protein
MNPLCFKQNCTNCGFECPAKLTTAMVDYLFGSNFCHNRYSNLFHPIECFLEQLQIGGLSKFLPSGINPFLFQGIFGQAIGLIKDAEDAGEGQLSKFIGCELVGHVVGEFVFGGVVPLLLFDQLCSAKIVRC